MKLVTSLAILVIVQLSAGCLEIYQIAKKYTKYPSTITAIALTESSCGKEVLGDDRKSFGIMQMQLPTLKYLMTKDKSIRYLKKLSDKQLETLLLRDDEVAIILAVKYFHFLLKHYGYKNAIIRYNGYWAVSKAGKALRDANGKRIKNVQYYNRIMKNMAIIKQTVKVEK